MEPHARGAPSRRHLLIALGAGALAACTKPRPSPAPLEPIPAPQDGAWRVLSFPASDAFGEERALVREAPAGSVRPVVVALHGRGESGRGLEAGARGWRDDYGLEQIDARLRAPPLSRADLGGFVLEERLRAINASLARSAYEGLVVACPYTPDLPDRSLQGARGFARFVVESLLRRVRAEHGGDARREATGIDGVSMGGRLALLVGLAHPETFGAVGALQPAIKVDEAAELTALVRRARAVASVSLRLVSSERDPFLPAVRAFSERMRSEGVEHELVVTPGPHDYAWNRGPGAAELLLWHERALRGLPNP